MGHIHLGTLPRTRAWQEVTALLGSGAPDGDVIASTAVAAERDLLDATGDPVFLEAVRLLLAVPLAARSEEFAGALRQLGLRVRDEPGVADIVDAAMRQLDTVAALHPRRKDIGELSSRALAGTFTDCLNSQLPPLFEANPEEVRIAARRLSFAGGVPVLARTFFSRLVGSVLAYWLDRELPNHIGAERRFRGLADRTAFDQALRLHASEATRIIQEFAPGWYGKTLHSRGTFETADIRRFGAVCLKKVVEELQQRRDVHA